MKNVAKQLIATALLGSALVSTSAMAEQKIGVVDMQSIFQNMPQAAEMQNSIQEEFKEQIDEVQLLQSEGQVFGARLQRDAATMSDAEKEELISKIENIQRQLQEKGQPLQRAIQERQNQERNKLLGLIKTAIDTVAAKQGYDLVLTSGSVAYVNEKHDISGEVQKLVNKTN